MSTQPKYKMLGQFRFDGFNIKSSENMELNFALLIPGLDMQEHVCIKKTIKDTLGLEAQPVPTAWGDNPPRYDEVIFETTDLSLAKHLCQLLSNGRDDNEDEITLLANGYRYTEPGHPLFPTFSDLEHVPLELRDFNTLKAFIDKTVSEAKSPIVPNVSTNTAKPEL